MKKFAIALAVVATSAFAATPQQFNRADAEKSLVEAGWMMNTYTTKSDAANAEEQNTGATSFDISYSRGISTDMAAGVKIGNSTMGNGGGLKDLVLFVEGQHDKFFYGVDLAISEDQHTDSEGKSQNSKSGGMNYTFTLGYGFMDNAGVRLDYTPGFTATSKTDGFDSAETDLGATSWIQAYYEFDLGGNTLGAALGQNSQTPNADDTDQNRTYTTIEAYYVHALSTSLDLTAGLRNWMGSVENYETFNVSGMDVGVRFKF